MIPTVLCVLFCFLVNRVVGDADCDDKTIEISVNFNYVAFSMTNSQKACNNLAVTSSVPISDGNIFNMTDSQLNLTNSRFSDLNFTRSDQGSGGFLYAISPKSITISDCSFTNITVGGTGSGGVFYVALNSPQASFSVTNTNFTSCVASGNGGAIYVSATDLVGFTTRAVLIANCNFKECLADLTSAGGGGAVYITSAGTGFTTQVYTISVENSVFDSNHVRSSLIDIDTDGTALAVYHGSLQIKNTQLLDYTGKAVLLQATNLTYVLISNSTIRGRHPQFVALISSHESDNEHISKHLLGADIGDRGGLLSFVQGVVLIQNSTISDSRHGGIFVQSANITVELSTFSNNLAGNTERFPSLRQNFVCGTKNARLEIRDNNVFSDVVHYTENYKWYDSSSCADIGVNINTTIPAPILSRVEVIDRDQDNDWKNRSSASASSTSTTSSSSSSSSSSTSLSLSSHSPHSVSHTHSHPLSHTHYSEVGRRSRRHSFSSRHHTHTSSHDTHHPHADPNANSLSRSLSPTTTTTTTTTVTTPTATRRRKAANAGYDSLKINGFLLFPLNGTKAVVYDNVDNSSTAHFATVTQLTGEFAYVDQHTLIFVLPSEFKGSMHPGGIWVSVCTTDAICSTAANITFAPDSAGTVWGQWNPDWRQMDFDDAYGLDANHLNVDESVKKALYRGIIGGVVLLVILAVIVLAFALFLYFLRKRAVAEYLHLHPHASDAEGGQE